MIALVQELGIIDELIEGDPKIVQMIMSKIRFEVLNELIELY